jgi:hypothetical protein
MDFYLECIENHHMEIAYVNLPKISNVYGKLCRVVSDWLLVQNSRTNVEKKDKFARKASVRTNWVQIT